MHLSDSEVQPLFLEVLSGTKALVSDLLFNLITLGEWLFFKVVIQDINCAARLQLLKYEVMFSLVASIRASWFLSTIFCFPECCIFFSGY